MPVAQDQFLTVRLQSQHWNQILQLMQDAPAPYRVSAPLIQAMMTQLTEQLPVEKKQDNVVPLSTGAAE